MFLDEVSITVRAGDGGDGASTFRREAHVPRGGPDGGDGGRGGSVYLMVDAGETMLRDYRHKHHFRADSGTRGEGSKRHGKAGRDLHLKVPPGTVVRDAQSGDLLADLVSREQTVMVARGGRGGLGNVQGLCGDGQRADARSHCRRSVRSERPAGQCRGGRWHRPATLRPGASRRRRAIPLKPSGSRVSN